MGEHFARNSKYLLATSEGFDAHNKTEGNKDVHTEAPALTAATQKSAVRTAAVLANSYAADPHLTPRRQQHIRIPVRTQARLSRVTSYTHALLVEWWLVGRFSA